MKTKFILNIENLYKSFGGNQVLENLSFKVFPDQITAIIGKSGTGKSVLLKTIAGLLDLDSGRVEAFNTSADGMFSKCKLKELGFSYMFQSNALFDTMDTYQNIALPLIESSQEFSKREIDKKVDLLLQKLELVSARNKYPDQMSGGMKKRVAFARAIITEPKIVLFDEPTTGLDPERKSIVYEMIKLYKKQIGFSALIVSHDIPEIYEIADNLIWLDEGKIKFSGTINEIEKVPDPIVKNYLKTGRINSKISL